MKKHGFQDITKFTEVLPQKSRSRIIYFLNKYKKSAKAKLKRRKDYNIQYALREVHPWLPFINMHCNVKPMIHKHLIAFVLPFIEQYAKTESKGSGYLNFG